MRKKKDKCLIDDLEKQLLENDSQFQFDDTNCDKAREKLFNLPFFEQNGFSNDDFSDISFPHLLFSLLLNNNATEQQQAQFIENIKKSHKNKGTCSQNKNDNDDNIKSVDDDDSSVKKSDILFKSAALPKHVTHLKKIISVHKYAKNHFNKNIEDLLFYIIEPILSDVLFLPRILELLRLVKSSNHQKYFEESLFLAINKFKEITSFNDNIIFVLQCAFSSGLISLPEAQQIASSIIPDELLDYYIHIFDYIFNKNKEFTLTKDKEIFNLKKTIESLRKPSIENEEKQEHIYNAFLTTVLQNVSKEPEGRRYNDFFILYTLLHIFMVLNHIIL